MLVSFIDTTKNGLDEMKEAVQSGHLESVGNLAHKLLPPCRHIGASELTDLLRKIEESIQNNSGISHVEELTEEIFRKFESVSQLINEHITKIN